MPKVALAYSGSLDTTICVHYLRHVKGMKVYTFSANLGQPEYLAPLAEGAVELGAAAAHLADLRDKFARDYIFPCIRANAIYEQGYFLFSALSRPLIVEELVQIADDEGCEYIAHGSRGIGNDMLRITNCIRAVAPSMKVLTPLVDLGLRSPKDDLEYAKKTGLQFESEKQTVYNVEQNLWGNNIQLRDAKDTWDEPPKDTYILTSPPEDSPVKPAVIEIEFREGIPVGVDGEELSPVQLIEELNRIGGRSRDRPVRRRGEPHQRAQDARDLRVARGGDPADGPPGPGVHHPRARGDALQGVALAALCRPRVRGQVVPLGARGARRVLLQGQRERHRHGAAEPLPGRHHRDGPQVAPFALRAAPGAAGAAFLALQDRAMKVEILSTGTELLRGKNVDTNAAWLAQQLGRAGFEVIHHQTCDDDFGRLVDALKLAASRSDLLIMTGGLGPTEDDYTRRRPRRRSTGRWSTVPRSGSHPGPLQEVEAAHGDDQPAAGVRAERRERPAEPERTAPGFLIREGHVRFVALPGPPSEDGARCSSTTCFRRSERGRTSRSGPANSTAFRKDRRRDRPQIVGKRASYGLTVRWGRVNITLQSGGATSEEGPRRLCAKPRLRVRGSMLRGAEVHEVVARRLIETKTTLAVAESCTGGLISHRLTEVPGISDVLLESVVTYSNESKVRRLGVDPELIRKHGAVSEEVARAMALGVARTSGARIGVAVTGIAGPGGGSEKKPTGLCYMAVDDRVESRVFTGDRSHVKERAAGYALNMLRLRLGNGAR